MCAPLNDDGDDDDDGRETAVFGDLFHGCNSSKGARVCDSQTRGELQKKGYTVLYFFPLYFSGDGISLGAQFIMLAGKKGTTWLPEWISLHYNKRGRESPK